MKRRRLSVRQRLSKNRCGGDDTSDRKSEKPCEVEKPSEELKEEPDADDKEELHEESREEEPEEYVRKLPGQGEKEGEPEENIEEEPEEEFEEDEEEDPCEEPEVEEEPSQEEPTETEEPSEEEMTEEELNEEEMIEEEPDEEEMTEEESNEEEPNEEDYIEEEPSALSPAHVSHHSDNDKHAESACSSSGKNKRLGDTASDHAQKKQKMDLLSEPKSDIVSSTNLFSEGQEHVGSSGKRKQRRWDAEPGADAVDDGGTVASRKRKTRWATDDTQLKMLGPLQLPDFVKGLVDGAGIDPEIEKLNAKLFEINQKLKARELVNDRTEGQISPSSRINSREAMLRNELIKKRQKIISALIKKNPTFNPPDYRSTKFHKKLYIPVKEYPGYNFIGLIIGPFGNTQKRMEKETGARIHLRGKGSKLEKVQKQKKLKPDPSDNDDLHVVVEADNQQSLDAAVGMVEKLLVPVEDEWNLHKLAQLRELAKLKGSLKEKSVGGSGTLNKECKFSVSCDICGDAGHLTVACPLTAPGANADGQQAKFLAELGGGISPFGAEPIPTSTTTPSVASQISGSVPNKVIDESNLFVGYLPASVNEDSLIDMFAPFGKICLAKVIRDKITGLSKGYGFVKYTDPSNAAKAIVQMHGYQIENKKLAVRVAGVPPQPNSNMGMGAAAVASGSSHHPMYPTIASVGWPTPPGSMLPQIIGYQMNPVPHIGQPPAFISSYQTIPYVGPLYPPYSGQPPASVVSSYQSSAQSSISPGEILESDLAQFPGYLNSLDPDFPLQQLTSSIFPSITQSSGFQQSNLGKQRTSPL